MKYKYSRKEMIRRLDDCEYMEKTEKEFYDDLLATVKEKECKHKEEVMEGLFLKSKETGNIFKVIKNPFGKYNLEPIYYSGYSWDYYEPYTGWAYSKKELLNRFDVIDNPTPLKRVEPIEIKPLRKIDGDFIKYSDGDLFKTRINEIIEHLISLENK